VAFGAFSVRMVGKWRKALAMTSAMSNPVVVLGALDAAMLSEAHRARVLLVKGLHSGAPGGKRFAPLAKTTMMVRSARGGRGAKGSKPLNKTGALGRAITVKHQRGQGAFVGILRTARNATGKSLVNLMQLHEGGKTIAIKVTPQMLRFLMAMFRKKGNQSPGKGGGGRGIIIVRIPARPLFGPVWTAYFRPSDINKRVGVKLGALMGAGVAMGGIKAPSGGGI